jgi:hypothetical protein
MGIVVEPSLICDECSGRIEPGEEYFRLQLKELVRVESPTYTQPYAYGNSVGEVEYVHEECLERPARSIGIDEAKSDDWTTGVLYVDGSSSPIAGVRNVKLAIDRNFSLDSKVDWSKLASETTAAINRSEYAPYEQTGI